MYLWLFRSETCDALEWLAAMLSHVPNKGEQMVRYYGYYSNVSQSKRRKHDQDEWILCILGPVGSWLSWVLPTTP